MKTFNDFVQNLDWGGIDSLIPSKGIAGATVNELSILKDAYHYHQKGDYDKVYFCLGGDPDQVAAWGYAYPTPIDY